MTTQGHWWLAGVGLVVATFGAIGARALQEFSRRQLDYYCRRRGKKELFKEIVGHHDDVALGAEVVEILGVVTAAFSGALAVAGGTALPAGRLAPLLAAAALILLVATCWLPWAITTVWSAPFLYHTWRLWQWVNRAVLPLALGVDLLSNVMGRLSGRPEPDDEEIFEEEIRTIVSQGIGDGVIEEEAREMIEGVMELDESDVGDVMTPRSQIEAVDIDMPWDEVVAYVADSQRTRLPVYEGSIDNIVGMLYVKDLLAEMTRPAETRRPVRQLLREPLRVLKSVPLDTMLKLFLSDNRSHLAVVVGEYGTVEGVVTIEDVLEEIVGEIADESDEDEPESIQEVGENVFEVVASTHVADVNEELGLEIPEGDDFDTLGGFVTRQLGRIPRIDDHVEADGIRVTVLAADDRSAQRLRVERLGD